MSKSALRTATKMLGFGLRHLAAIAITTIVPCLLWTAVYIGLLLYAMITNEGLGGPLAYPVGLIGIFVVSLVISIAYLFPITAIGEWFTRRYRCSIFFQIPLLAAVTVLTSLALCWISFINEPDLTTRDMIFASLLIINPPLLFLLGLYWWVAQSIPLVSKLVSWIRQKLILSPNIHQ